MNNIKLPAWRGPPAEQLHQAPRLHLERLTRRFGEIEAVRDVSFSVASGEIVTMVGQSGCGKSTLLRLIAGVDRQDQGRIIMDGAEIAGPSAFVEPEQRRIGFVFQDYALFPHLDVMANIQFGLKNLPKDAAKTRSADIVTRLGIWHLSDRYPHMLSGGEQQRVALARALAPEPRILLMDEPFSNLDRKLRDTVREETLSLLRQLQTTVIMVTHDPEEALSAGDRVVLLRAGNVIQIGSAADLYERPSCAYAAEFFCTYNKVRGACWNGFLETPLGRFKAHGYADGAEATAYLRPQSLRISTRGEGISGQVVQRALMGEVEQLSLAVGNLAEPLRVRSTERNRVNVGQTVQISIRPEDALVF